VLRFLWILIAIFFLSIKPTLSEIYEVKMLNRGVGGFMIFEPDYIKIKPGDTVVFRPVDKNHNAESIQGMTPVGFPAFKGNIDEKLIVTFDIPGFYGIKCTPHYVSGMVMLIKVGEANLSESYRSHEQPGLARRKFDNIFNRIDSGE